MQSMFNFEPLLVFGFLSIMLLIGIVLRSKISFLQKFLFPSCLVGGFVAMFLTNLRVVDFEFSTFETFAYHFFNISFISVGFTRDDNNGAGANRRKGFLKGPLWMALVQGTVFPIQAIIGGLTVIIFGLMGTEIFQTFGFLMPLGFNEGPGQALSFGKVWEGMGFEHATTIGLTFASLGFFFAFLVGVPICNWGIRKGLSTFSPKDLPREILTGIIPENMKGESGGELKLHSGNVDSMAFQAALVGLAYVITYLLVDSVGYIFGGDVAKMLWGFFFIFGLGVAILIKWIMEKMGVAYLADPGVQRRITGWSIDFLIVATVAAIQLLVVWKFFLPIFLISFIGGILTTFIVFRLGSRLPAYNLERMVSIYGCLTGTLSSGLLLLRIVDPDLKTPVALEVALMNIFAIPIIFTCLLMVNAPLWWGWSLGLTLAAFGGMMVLSFVLMKVFGLITEPKF